VNQGNERKLRASDELFAKAFNANPHSMSLATLEEGRILEVNESFVIYRRVTNLSQLVNAKFLRW
jgi:hypothetical protein